jgi:hypothetical protein
LVFTLITCFNLKAAGTEQERKNIKAEIIALKELLVTVSLSIKNASYESRSVVFLEAATLEKMAALAMNAHLLVRTGCPSVNKFFTDFFPDAVRQGTRLIAAKPIVAFTRLEPWVYQMKNHYEHSLKEIARDMVSNDPAPSTQDIKNAVLELFALKRTDFITLPFSVQEFYLQMIFLISDRAGLLFDAKIIEAAQKLTNEKGMDIFSYREPKQHPTRIFLQSCSK